MMRDDEQKEVGLELEASLDQVSTGDDEDQRQVEFQKYQQDDEADQAQSDGDFPEEGVSEEESSPDSEASLSDETAEEQGHEPELSKWDQRQLEFQQRKQEREAEQAQSDGDNQEGEAVAAADLADGADPVSAVADEGFGDDEGVNQEDWDESDGGDQAEELVAAAVFQRPKRTPNMALQKAMPLILFSLIVALLSAFTISPYSKEKVIEVTGTVYTTPEEVLTASKIKDSDYISQVLLGLGTHERAIVANDLWVKSARIRYDFPNRFSIAVEEFPIVAYQETVEGFHPILASGDRGEMVTASQLPAQFLRIDLVDAKDIQQFIRQLMTVDKSVREGIAHVALVGSESTEDLLVLTMSDGHLVRVPLSEVALKLPYYKSIRTRLTEPSIVDMEVGIYATTEYLELQASETRASKEKEAQELEALYGTSSSSKEATETQTETTTSSVD